MSLTLSRFAVFGLHGKFDVDIPVFDNKLILVGVNGLGKTTVVNLIYFVLTAQWSRVLESDFTSIELEFCGREISISRQDIQNKSNLTDRYEKVIARFAHRLPYPPSVTQRLLTHPSFATVTQLPGLAREKALRDLGRELELPLSVVSRIAADAPRIFADDLFESPKDSAAVSEYLSVLKESGAHQVIYLPTYRRIEQDLKSIFPNLDEDELRKLTARGESMLNPRKGGHVELVQFGMQDVERKISDELEAIRERTRSQLTNLTASYLKDIIRNRADDVQTDLLRKIDERIITAVLDRVEENTLSAEDKREVRFALDRIRKGERVFDARDKYLAYFFSRLLEIYVSLSGSEEKIRRLIETCNRYFERKYIVYDDAKFTASVVDADQSPLSWRVLSSGEKQVASLFTHLYLSREVNQAVIIDEPELSLSVQWQKALLPDIARSENCRLLIAVTHSPFIYANELEDYAVDLAKFISYNPHSSRQ